ncbi:hypothetical protein [Geodermatophilus sp. DF01-2]|uniref:hypothetical protein n=1 Tax=Geodermatophilus sp. DF01-2 TaxID=2559610 RepID=UPI001FD73D1C|nr:hypothetical protein [Geodermatophilus sp. DF01_2]
MAEQVEEARTSSPVDLDALLAAATHRALPVARFDGLFAVDHEGAGFGSRILEPPDRFPDVPSESLPSALRAGCAPVKLSVLPERPQGCLLSPPGAS